MPCHSQKGAHRSFGLMVDDLYSLDEIEKNQAARLKNIAP